MGMTFVWHVVEVTRDYEAQNKVAKCKGPKEVVKSGDISLAGMNHLSDSCLVKGKNSRGFRIRAIH